MFSLQKTIQMIAIILILIIVGGTTLQAEESSATPAVPGMTHAMQRSMDPQVWTNMMTMMMTPEKLFSMESCAQCHEGEDLARYQKDFGPMLEAMKPMMSWMNPHMMTSMMNPMMGMMNPAMYMNMMYPMMGMMGPMMGMMGPMMNPMMWMNPMAMMNPGMWMGGMGNPMMGGMGMHGGNPMGQMMDPKQYENWFNEMMKGFTPQNQQ